MYGNIPCEFLDFHGIDLDKAVLGPQGIRKGAIGKLDVVMFGHQGIQVVLQFNLLGFLFPDQFHQL